MSAPSLSRGAWASLGVVAAVAVCLGGRGSRAAEPEPAGKVALARLPGGGIQPQVVIDGEGTVHAVYLRGEAKAGELWYARAEGGGKFSDPLRVNRRPNAIALGTIRGAHLAVGQGGRVHVAWYGVGEADRAGESKKETPLLYARLDDAGRAFEPERNVIGSAFGLDGGGSVAADAGGNVYVAWHAPAPGTRGEANRRVLVTRSSDGGKTFAPEKAADAKPAGACGCCGLRAFADAKGSVYVLYRSATDGVHRDTHLLVSRDRGATFEGGELHRWELARCPMSSYAFAEGGGGVLAAWETEGQVFYARIDPATGARSAPAAAPGGAKGRKHPAVAANARGETVLAWTEGTGWDQGGAVAWQVYDKAGRPTSEKGRAEGVPAWGLVAAYARPDGGFTVVY